MANEVKVKDEKNITDSVLKKIKAFEDKGEIQFPVGYSYQNALKSAYLILQETKTSKSDGSKPVLEACSTSSIANTLLNMVVQGLNPAKKQCYFIPYGNQLTLSTSYFGSMSIAKRLKGVVDVVANCIYKDDVFEYGLDFSTGNRMIKKHEQKIENVDFKNMVGAYAIVIREGDEPNYIEVMSMAQLEQSWNQSKFGKGKVHDNFKDQMAMKTVINRACKHFVNTSDDSDLLAEAYNQTEAAEYEKLEDSDTKLLTEANSIEVDVPPVYEEVTYKEVDSQPNEIVEDGPEF